jgi:hypothetical protein
MTGKSMPKVMITERAAKQRINRALRPDQQMLKVARTQQAILDNGRFFVIDFGKNYLVRHDVDLEAFGHELGVIEQWESVA